MARRKTNTDYQQLAFDLWALEDGNTDPATEPSSDIDDSQAAPEVAEAPAETMAPVSTGSSNRDDSGPVPPARPHTSKPGHGSQAPAPLPQLGSTAVGAVRVDSAVAISELVQHLVEQGRSANDDERIKLAGWPGWGATPQLFDENDPRYEDQRNRLKAVWSDQEWAAARRTVLNAHYTAPEYAEAIWSAVTAAGFAGGQVLEPGCGAGVFIATAPTSAQMTGIELDPTTAQIARLTHPTARILTESFADTTLDHDGYDAVVGNVPFGKLALYDPEYNAGKHSIHNHFIIKSLRLTKPGGIVAVLTSRHTLDAKDESARRAIAEHGALLGAVRLPGGAHQQVAGTDVITDLLIFRRHLPGQVDQLEPTWLTTHEMDLPGGQVRVNDYFDAHPDHVLGEMSTASGRFGPELKVAMAVATPTAVAAELHAVATAIATAAATAGHGWAATGHTVTDRPRPASRGGHDHPIGHLGQDADGTLWAQGLTGRVPVAATPKVAIEVRRLLELRDAAVKLLTLEATPTTEAAELATARDQLNAAYDTYHASHGPVARMVTRATGKLDEDGEPIIRRIYPPAIQLLRGDPHFATVAALEHYDDETETARKAEIFSTRVIGATTAATTADSAEDAIAISMDRLGRIDLDYISDLLGIEVATATEKLKGLVFVDPGLDEHPERPSDDRLVTRAEYLSGDVRRKLKRVRQLVAARPELADNITALEEVQPAELGPAEIDVTPNAAWLPTATVRQWLETITGKDVIAERIAGTWKMRIKGSPSLVVQQKYSTDQVSVHQVLTKVLNGDDLKVTKEITVGDTTRRVVDVDATAALVEVAETVSDHFQDWIWRDPERADELQERYNDLFNGITLRSYDGVELTLPGKAAGFQPRPHQHAAVARMIAEPSCGLFHEVGAGKTAEMVMGVMELKRLGMITKPAIIVPNNMLEQFTREFKQIYPAASVLAAGGADLARSGDHDGRKLFVARAAMGSWDAIIITQNAFTRIGLGADSEQAFIQAKKTEFEQQLTDMRNSQLSADTVKTVENKIARYEERLKELTTIPRDRAALSFEETGIDYLVVDEAHGYKNLSVETSVADLQKAKGSQKATDMEMKLWYLREVADRDRVCTMATATPIANSMIEMYVMQRYLRPDLLAQAGVLSADAWAAQFTRQVPAVEQTIAGEFRMVTRTAAFRNIPELLKMWHTAADVKTAADLNLPVPALRPRDSDGERAPEVVSVSATGKQRALIESLLARAEQVRGGLVDPTTDNMLKISSDGRTIAMDARLVDESLTPEPGEETKIGTAAAPRIHAIWRDHQHTLYKAPDGTDATLPGALQIVFADRGTPSERWNAYEALKAELVTLGMPAESVRFIHDAATDEQKAALFTACRDGRVAVLIGSTERMGTGTNIQHRAIALHHLDCPWRPADVTQREGRLVRQHNQNPEVGIFRYVTKGSFDGYMWQTVTRKAKFIEQVLAGRLDVREMEDLGETTLSFAEVAAIAADDMRILEKAQLESEVTKLRRAQRAFTRGTTAAKMRLASIESRLPTLQGQVEVGTVLIERRKETRGDAFRASLSGYGIAPGSAAAQIADRREFGQQLLAALRYGAERLRPSRYNPGPLLLGTGAKLGGLEFHTDVRDTTITNGGTTLSIHLRELPEVRVEISGSELETVDVLALTQRLERRVAGMDAQVHRWLADIDELERNQSELEAIVAAPWGKADELTVKAARLDDLVRELARDKDTEPEKPNPTSPRPAHRVEAPAESAAPTPAR